MRTSSQSWYFPVLLLIGSLILTTLSFTACGPLASHHIAQCPGKQRCPHTSTTASTQVARSTTIVETPVSKKPLKAYVILSSSDSLSSGRIVPGGARLHIQFTPDGKLTNGHAGRTLFFSRIATEDDIGLQNIPPGTYTMQVSGTDNHGQPLKLCLSYNDDEPAPRQIVELQDGLLGVEGQSATLVQLMTCPS